MALPASRALPPPTATTTSMALLPGELRAGAGEGDVGFAVDVDEPCIGTEGLDEPLRARRRRAGDDERASAEPADDLGRATGGAGPEHDAPRRGELPAGRRVHQSASSGKTAVYFTPERGSAIMRRDGVAPGGVVRRLLVRDGRLDGAVDLDEHEARRVVLLLDHVEPGDAGFADAVAGVRDGRGAKRLDRLRFHVDVHMDDDHAAHCRSHGRPDG